MSNDREHFERYRLQTRVKHEILAAYLPAYFHILKRGQKDLNFIDGFAGRGFYTQPETGETFEGSPLLALKLLAETADFANQVSTVFIESDIVLFHELDKNVAAFYSTHPEIRKPKCFHDNFSDRVNKMLGVDGRLAPTFLFVDPCGVSGASFNTIQRVMDCDKCEVFIFFNIDGVRRIAGLEPLSSVLVELMGTKERAQEIYRDFRTTKNVNKHEQMILKHYFAALREDIGAKYISPFRVEHEDQQKTSHYLIHATKHPLGFRIMKDVMWRRGHSEDQSGGLELRQRGRTNFIPMFDTNEDIKQEILEGLRVGLLQVAVFYQEWTIRPNNLQCESSYRQALLELEASDKIEVLGKDGKSAAGAGTRRKVKGKLTLAKDYFVRLRS